MRNFNIKKAQSIGVSTGLCGIVLTACSPEDKSEAPTHVSPPHAQTVTDIPENSPTIKLSHLAQIEASEMDPMCIHQMLEFDGLNKDMTAAECLEGYEIYSYKRDYPNIGSYQVAYANERNTNHHVEYKPIGKLGNSLIVELHWDWGGRTRFNTLARIAERDDTLKIVDTYMFGDRCKGGLANVRIAEGKVYYGQNLTHFGLLNVFAKTKADRNIAYEGVTDSIGDCVAEADYVDHEFLGLNFSEKKMDYIHNSRVSQTDNPIQYCYDEILLENVKHNNRFIKAEHVPAFIRDIQYTCIGTPRPITFPVTVFPDVSTATNTVLEQCADGLALACDLTRSNEEISDHQFSTIHRHCNAGEKIFCTLLDNLIAAEVRDH